MPEFTDADDEFAIDEYGIYQACTACGMPTDDGACLVHQPRTWFDQQAPYLP